MPIRQSFSWWCFADRGVEDRVLLESAKNIGYHAVELVPEHKLGLASELGLQIASHGAHPLSAVGLNNPDDHAEIECSVLASIDLAKRFLIENLIVFSGNRDLAISEEQAAENCAEGIRRFIRQAEDAGVNIVMELLNSRVDHPRYQCDSTTWGVSVCEQVDSSHFGLLYDIYHMQIMEGDLIRTIQNHHKHFLHYHTAGNPGRRDLDEHQEINYPAVLLAIKATGYSGFIGHEFIPKGDVLPALERAYELGHDSL